MESGDLRKTPLTLPCLLNQAAPSAVTVNLSQMREASNQLRRQQLFSLLGASTSVASTLSLSSISSRAVKLWLGSPQRRGFVATAKKK
jgi:hypothetical protein